MSSEGGQTFSDIRQSTREFNAKVGMNQKADIEELEDFLEEFEGKPFFVSMDSDAVWSTNKNRRVILAELINAVPWELGNPDNFGYSLTLRETL